MAKKKIANKQNKAISSPSKFPFSSVSCVNITLILNLNHVFQNKPPERMAVSTLKNLNIYKEGDQYVIEAWTCQNRWSHETFLPKKIVDNTAEENIRTFKK